MRTRKASATWEGTLKGGNGSFSGESGAIGGQYSFGSRFENGTGSNPEELLAAAEAACFSMALSGNLEKAGFPPNRIDTHAACTVEKTDAGMTITSITLDVTVAAANLTDETLQKLVSETKDGCPVSRAFKGNVKITADARLV